MTDEEREADKVCACTRQTQTWYRHRSRRQTQSRKKSIVLVYAWYAPARVSRYEIC
jgi:hypothetical protein